MRQVTREDARSSTAHCQSNSHTHTHTVVCATCCAWKMLENVGKAGKTTLADRALGFVEGSSTRGPLAGNPAERF